MATEIEMIGCQDYSVCLLGFGFDLTLELGNLALFGKWHCRASLEMTRGEGLGAYPLLGRR
jgi:hypothetical protein